MHYSNLTIKIDFFLLGLLGSNDESVDYTGVTNVNEYVLCLQANAIETNAPEAQEMKPDSDTESLCSSDLASDLQTAFSGVFRK